MVEFYYKNNNTPKTNMPMSIGCVGIIKKDTKVLMEHRTDSDRWAFIGGKMEPNEDAETAVVREIKEETNLNVIGVNLLNIFSDPSRVIKYENGNCKRVITILFNIIVKDFHDLKCSEESREVKFIDINDISFKDIAETHIPILEFIRKS